MKKFELILTTVFAIVLVASNVTAIIAGEMLIAWCINAIWWFLIMWGIFRTLCEKLDVIAMGIHAILFGKVEEVITVKKADDEPKTEAEPEQK